MSYQGDKDFRTLVISMCVVAGVMFICAAVVGVVERQTRQTATDEQQPACEHCTAEDDDDTGSGGLGLTGSGKLGLDMGGAVMPFDGSGLQPGVGL